MKVRKLVWPLFAVCFLSVACEDKTETPEPEAAPADGAAKNGAGKAAQDAAAPAAAAPAPIPVAAKEPPPPGPQDICTGLIGAVKTKDETKVLALSTTATATAVTVEGAKDHLMAALAPVSCGTPKVDGDTAVVLLSGGELPYEASFVKAADGWKFDGAAFLAKYPPAAKGKGKKGAAHDKGKKVHGKHKGH